MIEIYITVTFFLIVLRKIRITWNRKKRYNKLKPFKVKEGAKPYFIKKGKTCCLLLHGYTSSPQEFKLLTKYLTENNLSIYAPLLKGHGTDPIDLANTNYKDWLKSAKEALEKVKKEYDSVILIGNSMGGNLAFLLEQDDKVKAIISLGTPIFFRWALTTRLVTPVLYLFKEFQRKHFTKDIKEIIKKNKREHYEYYPINTVSSVLKLMKLTRHILNKINKPTLVMQSSKDITLENKNALFIYNNIKCENKKIVFIPDSYHVFIIDKYKEMAFKEIYKFIKKLPT